MTEAHDASRRLPTCIVRLIWTEPWQGPPAPHLLRGAVAAAFPESDLFHQHTVDGKPIYRYPRIQYRWDPGSGEGIIAGFGDGVETLTQLFVDDLELRLGDRLMAVREAHAQFSRHTIRILPRLRRYHFRSPWLPLNQENYERYQAMSRPERAAELDRIAVGNILSALKGLNIRIQEQVYAAFMPRRRLSCRYKDQALAGFLGTFMTNVDLPNDFALGKAVSHGYGWLRTIGAAEQAEQGTQGTGLR